MGRLGRTIAFAALALMLVAGSASAKDVSDKRQCLTGDIKCVHHVIQEMEQRFRKLSKACDHDAVFALAYLRTTEVYEQTARTIGYDDVASVTREDALFADYYFRAHDAYHGGSGYVPPAWQIAFDAAEQRRVTALGNTLLGFNAHIQRDLPFVLYELYLRGYPVSYEDHTLVNTFLAQVEIAPEIISNFDPTYPPPDGDISLVVGWREQAWQNYVLLREASTDAQRAAVAADIERAAAESAASLAALTAYPAGTDSDERDAYCEAH